MEWIKSSYCSGGDCVELAWQKSSFSSGGYCVETAPHDGHVLMRDSKDPDGPWLRFTREEFAAFVKGVKAGEFDHLAGAG